MVGRNEGEIRMELGIESNGELEEVEEQEEEWSLSDEPEMVVRCKDVAGQEALTFLFNVVGVAIICLISVDYSF